MLPSGAALVPSLPAPASERSETQDPDPSSDGRFASLMAQFVPVQTPVPKPDPSAPTGPASSGPGSGPADGTPGTAPAASQAAAGQAACEAKGATTPAAPSDPAASPQAGSEAPGKPDPAPAGALAAAAVPTPPQAGAVPAAVPTPPVPSTPSAAPDPRAAAPAAPSAPAAPPLPAETAPASDPKAAAQPKEGKAALLLAAAPAQTDASQAARAQDPASGPALTAALASTPAPARPASPLAVSSSDAKAAVIAPATPAGPSAPGSGSTGQSGTGPGAQTALAKTSEGGPASQEAAARPDAAVSFQVHLHPDAGTQTAAAASARTTAAPETAPAQAPASSAPSAAPAALPAAPTVTQVDSGMRWMLKNGTQEARLQLHPESLGQVTIHLRVAGGEVHARLWVSDPSSLQAVRDGRTHLELSLKEQGLQLGSFDLQQGSRSFQEAPAPQTPSFPDRLPAIGARQETPAVPAATLANAHQIEIYA